MQRNLSYQGDAAWAQLTNVAVTPNDEALSVCWSSTNHVTWYMASVCFDSEQGMGPGFKLYFRSICMIILIFTHMADESLPVEMGLKRKHTKN